ncbi:YhgE/Pip domain-containing protein [Pelomonas sp. KK5]|uniref:YhgE/Pip domain-containing protein n=1 Tax=Pelomonas sp. KK5 TaxID=1855730 RepID=UPI00097BBE6C|nr:YhgE/Pip domain-containing protein [Pelomonas sp. KK5]
MFLKDAWSIAKAETGLLLRFPTLAVSVLGILLIPALYAFIYLSSVWDPYGRSSALPVAIVDLDEGYEYAGQPVNLGRELADGLVQRQTFGFSVSHDEAAARDAVRAGRAAFALIIPKDFSAAAVPGWRSGGGRLIVFASEGNNYTGAGLAKRFAAELGHQVNETLNEKRWSLVLGSSVTARQSLGRLRDGVARLHEGALELDKGLAAAKDGSSKLAGNGNQFATAVTQLSEGVKQLGAGLREIESRRPSAQDLQQLRNGSAQMAAGRADLIRGLDELHNGAIRLTQGAVQMRDESKDIPFIGERVASGAGQLADGGLQLSQGLQQAHAAEQRLAEGGQRMGSGVAALAEGVNSLGTALSTITTRLPADARLNELSAGGTALAGGAKGLDGGLDKLRAGAHQLLAGLELLDSSLPDVPGLEGDPKGLAQSVAPKVEIDAPVPNNGTGFTPNILPITLWLGAVMTAFVFHMRRLPEFAARASRPAQLLGKLALPGVIVLLQSVVVLAMLMLALNIHVANLPALALMTAVAGIAFMLIIVVLTRAFGDAGKAIALILLILQLSSAGGVFPVELNGPFFRSISPWLPFTWVVKGVRASMFGAFGAEWLTALQVMMGIGVGAFVVAMLIGRWNFVGPEEHRPALDL